MPPNKASKAKAVNQTSIKSEEGEVYVTSYGVYYSKPKIDSQKISDVLKNNYLADVLEKTRNLLFTNYYDIEIDDPDGNPDDDLSKQAMEMMEAEDVDLYVKMQMAWSDVREWGISPFNPVWEQDGSTFILKKLRRLPPESFARLPPTMTNYISIAEILQGIIMVEDGSIQYWQTPDLTTSESYLIKNIFPVTDPVSSELGGTSKIIPLIPLISMLDFCWQAQIQKVNRIGAPVIFIRVKDPVKTKDRDDIKYANTILKSWGKNTSFQLRENMEIVNMSADDSDVALSTIESLKLRIKDYFNPSAMMTKEGSTIGGNAASELELFKVWIKGEHAWLESQFEKLLDLWLDLNGYDGYTAYLTITEEDSGVSDLEVRQAETGFKTRCLSPNEIREKLGVLELSDEEIIKMGEEWASIKLPAPSSPFGGQNASQLQAFATDFGTLEPINSDEYKVEDETDANAEETYQNENDIKPQPTKIVQSRTEREIQQHIDKLAEHILNSLPED